MPASERTWRDTARGFYRVLFGTCWLTGMAAFTLIIADQRGAPTEPTLRQSIGVLDNGVIHYVTAAQAARDALLADVIMIAIPFVLIAGALLQFVFHVQLIGPNARELAPPGRPLEA